MDPAEMRRLITDPKEFNELSPSDLIFYLNQALPLQVRSYLQELDKAREGSFKWFAAKALEQAFQAYTRGDLGIGAVLISIDREAQSTRWIATGNTRRTSLSINHAEMTLLTFYSTQISSRLGPEGFEYLGDSIFRDFFESMFGVLNRIEPHTLDRSTRLSKKLPDGVSMISTLEPCSMCTFNIAKFHIERLIYLADDPKGGHIATRKGMNSAPSYIRERLRDRVSQTDQKMLRKIAKALFYGSIIKSELDSRV